MCDSTISLVYDQPFSRFSFQLWGNKCSLARPTFQTSSHAQQTARVMAENYSKLDVDINKNMRVHVSRTIDSMQAPE